MKIQIDNLIPIQQEVNKKVREKLNNDLDSGDFVLAFNVEFFEYINAVGTWKWWKHSHEIKKEVILDELADCFAFFLSIVDYENQMRILNETEYDFISKIETELNNILETLKQYVEKRDDMVKEELLMDFCKYVGTDNESESVPTVERFTIAIFMATVLFNDITWEDMTEAYKRKSKINIQRQVEDY